METQKKPGGKKQGQKYKSLLVWDILLKKSDENHALRVADIQKHLENYGIAGERHSIRRDIEDILSVLNREVDFDLDELEIEERDLLGYEVVYDPVLHGYKVSHRPCDFEELRLLAECVRASRFISQNQENHLLAAIENMCSDYQVEELQNEVYLVGRSKTSNRHIMQTLSRLNQAIRENKKVSFHYQQYTIQDRTKQVDRHDGALYLVSPFKLIINDGNYYLLAWHTEKDKAITYRLDRMRGVEVCQMPRDGEASFHKIDMRTYTQQHFGMFSGEKVRVNLRFTMDMLDTVVDRFGTGPEVFYRPESEDYFVINTEVCISQQFFGWLCGLGPKVKLTGPPPVATQFREFLEQLAKEYNN